MNQKKYWLRVGIGFSLVGVLLLVVLELIERGPLGFLSSGSFDAFGFALGMFTTYPYLFVSKLLGYDVWNGERLFGGFGSNFFFYFITVLVWFIIGAIIGWIYGRIKYGDKSVV